MIQLGFFADIIEKELGIVYRPENYFQLEQRIEKIAQYLGLPGGLEVYRKVSQDGVQGELKQRLLDIATNNETSFFRDPKVFNAIEKGILPFLRMASPTSSLFRIWCAASSFGQEPYSLAMLVREFLDRNPGHPRFEIIATDISEQALNRARNGKYTQLEVHRGLSTERLQKYFAQSEDGDWTLKPEILSMVQFSKRNLLENFAGMGTFNLILCRYVLIYQNAERKKTVIQRLERCLSPGGYLALGASESALACTDHLEQIAADGAIFYRKTESGALLTATKPG